jgi:heme A synthase
MSYNALSLTITVIGLVITLITGWGALKGHYLTLTAWSRQRKIAKVQKEIRFVIRARDSDRELYIFALRYGFMLAALIGMSMMFSGLDTTDQGHKLNLFIHFLIGAFIYFFSVYTVANVVRVKNHQDTLEMLYRKLRKLGVDPDSTETDDA